MLRVARTTFSRNRAGEGGAIFLGGESGELKASQSTFSDNRAFGGGAISVRDGTAKLTNSTVSGNRAVYGGGLVLNNGGSFEVRSVTVVRNVALGTVSGTYGGGVTNLSGTFSVRNSLIAHNRAEGMAVGPDCHGEFTSGGANLLSSLDDCTGFGAGDFVRANPKLGQLANNGGPTKTISLGKKSPAIGKADKQSSPKRDQRGHKRDKHPDIGSFER